MAPCGRMHRAPDLQPRLEAGALLLLGEDRSINRAGGKAQRLTTSATRKGLYGIALTSLERAAEAPGCGEDLHPWGCRGLLRPGDARLGHEALLLLSAWVRVIAFVLGYEAGDGRRPRFEGWLHCWSHFIFSCPGSFGPTPGLMGRTSSFTARMRKPHVPTPAAGRRLGA